MNRNPHRQPVTEPVRSASSPAARWIAAACFVLPRNLALQLTFNTYVKSPYQTDALIVGTTADSDFGFAPHEIRHTVFLFDFVGDRFTPIESPSPLGVLAALALRPERVEDLSGYHAFIAAVEPELPLEQAGIALASYCKLVGMTVPGFDSAQLARWCAPRRPSPASWTGWASPPMPSAACGCIRPMPI